MDELCHQLEEKIANLDLKDENGGLSTFAMELRKDIWEEHSNVVIRNESLLHQKSRVTWLRDGANNTKFFNNTIKWKRRANNLKGVLKDGKWVDDPKIVKRE